VPPGARRRRRSGPRSRTRPTRIISGTTCRPACRTQGPRTRHRTHRALLARSHFGSSTQICPHAPGGVPMTPSHPSRTLLLLPRRRLATPRRMSGSVHSASTTSSTATSGPSRTLCGAERRSCGAADERERAAAAASGKPLAPKPAPAQGRAQEEEDALFDPPHDDVPASITSQVKWNSRGARESDQRGVGSAG
jgi:hypothetical protein